MCRRNRDLRRMAPLRALDLFAGIGGGSLALKAAGVRTVAYCEKDPFCQAVLVSNMSRGRLHSAPVFPDVTTLTASDLPKGGVDLIAAGFPCQGLSLAGKKGGLYGDLRSSLVKHVYRLVDETRPWYVFLENTPTIVHDGDFSRLLSELRDRGFRCTFLLSTAGEMGAPHQRKRWFLLACRHGGPKLRVSAAAGRRLARMFQQKPRSNVVPRSHQGAVHTCRTFGNAVVPAQAAAALKALNDMLCSSTSEMRKTSLAQRDSTRPCLIEQTGEVLQERGPARVRSQKCGGRGFTVVPPRGDKGRPSREIVTDTYWQACMPTARTTPSCAIPGRSMSARSKHDPGNFLLSSRELYPGGKVPDDEARSKLAVSDSFWAVSMGFPSNWVSAPLRALLRAAHANKRVV